MDEYFPDRSRNIQNGYKVKKTGFTVFLLFSFVSFISYVDHIYFALSNDSERDLLRTAFNSLLKSLWEYLRVEFESWYSALNVRSHPVKVIDTQVVPKIHTWKHIWRLQCWILNCFLPDTLGFRRTERIRWECIDQKLRRSFDMVTTGLDKKCRPEDYSVRFGVR